MLALEDLHAGHGETRVLHGVSLTVRAGRVHALLGRNGAGKSTLLRAAMGLLPTQSGRVTLDATDLGRMPAHARARAGLAFVPETRDIFGALTVAENLALAARLAPPDSAWTRDRVLELFPNLGPRLRAGGHDLSGGEQQMLAMARALVAGPRVLLLDEPTEGLAPRIVAQLAEVLATLRRDGMTILLVEQKLAFALDLADEVSLLGRGLIQWQGTPDALRADTDAQARWLGV